MAEGVSTVQTSARPAKEPRMVNVDEVIAGLTRLAKRQHNSGFISRANGVRSAIDHIRRELVSKSPTG